MPPPSRSSRGRNRSSESRLMVDEDVDDDLFLFMFLILESSAEIAHFSARQRDSPKASDGCKNEYNWLLTPPGTPLNGINRETKPVENPNPRNKARTQMTTTPRRSMVYHSDHPDNLLSDYRIVPSVLLQNGKTQTRRSTVAASPREAKREPSSNGNIKEKEKQNGFNLISVIEEVVPVPANGPSEQTFGRVIDFEKDVLDQNAHVKSETAAELSKTTEAQRIFGATENQMALTQISRPSLQQLVKSASDLKYFRYVYYKRNKNLQRFNRKTQGFETKKALSNKELVKPPKIESKCNCSIM